MCTNHSYATQNVSWWWRSNKEESGGATLTEWVVNDFKESKITGGNTVHPNLHHHSLPHREQPCEGDSHRGKVRDASRDRQREWESERSDVHQNSTLSFDFISKPCKDEDFYFALFRTLNKVELEYVVGSVWGYVRVAQSNTRCVSM